MTGKVLAAPSQEEADRLALYLAALFAAMILLVAYLVGLALVQANSQWLNLALPFVAEAVVVLATRILLRRGRPAAAALAFVWGSLAAIMPFVVMFPAAYPASVIAVAQIEAIALAYLGGPALTVTLVGLTIVAGAITALGNWLGASSSTVEKVSITVIVLLSFGLLSLILALNQRRLLLAISEARDARDHLEEKVAERTAELKRTARELEAATRAKSDFLANMSHELRTPLNAIMGFADLLGDLLEGKMDARQTRYLGNIRTAGQHLLGIINEVLDLARVEAGRIDLRVESLRLREVLEPVIASTRTSADAASLRFIVADVPDEVVSVDSARIRQILFNLLSNAVKFTPPGGEVRLAIGLAADELRFDVADTGVGIPAAQHGRVFGTFERLHEGKVEAEGSGLGLALTRRLVELHGGTIDFESEEGRGSTFRVRIPVSVQQIIPGDRLLIIEDVPADAQLLTAAAAEAGFRSEIVSTVRAARDAIARQAPVAIVLDVRLPDVRGDVLLEELKADPLTRKIPVIVVTVEDDEGKTRRLGALEHFTKPLDRARFVATLRRIAGERSSP